MLKQIDQLKFVLTSDPLPLIQQQLLPGQLVSQFRYKDLINVTADEVQHFVDTIGFPDTYVYEAGDPNAVLLDDQIRIIPSDGNWKVFYTERGGEYQVAYFSTREEARRDVVDRLMHNAKILINARFRQAHPELNLPPPREME